MPEARNAERIARGPGNADLHVADRGSLLSGGHPGDPHPGAGHQLDLLLARERRDDLGRRVLAELRHVRAVRRGHECREQAERPNQDPAATAFHR